MSISIYSFLRKTLYLIEKVEYTVYYQKPYIIDKGKRYMFDLLLEKEGKKYVIEIKDYHNRAYLHYEHLASFLQKSEEVLPGIERVLFIDTSRVTKEVREKESEFKNLKIIDLSQIKQLLGENRIDILEQTD
jgi:hypothetical protein